MAAPRAVLHIDDSLPTVHLVRHAQGYHQLPPEAPREDLPDPSITPYGREQCERLRENFPHHAAVDLVCSSPIRRAIQTTLAAFEPVVAPAAAGGRGLRVLLLPDAQESSDKPMDVGSPVAALRAEFGDRCDYSLLEAEADWTAKTGLRRNEMTALYERARRLRCWLRERPERQIVLVSHGLFAHYLTGNIDAQGVQTGEYWTNVRCRSFGFGGKEYPSAILVETAQSMERTAAGLLSVHHESTSEGHHEQQVHQEHKSGVKH